MGNTSYTNDVSPHDLRSILTSKNYFPLYQMFARFTRKHAQGIADGVGAHPLISYEELVAVGNLALIYRISIFKQVPDDKRNFAKFIANMTKGIQTAMIDAKQSMFFHLSLDRVAARYAYKIYCIMSETKNRDKTITRILDEIPQIAVRHDAREIAEKIFHLVSIQWSAIEPSDVNTFKQSTFIDTQYGDILAKDLLQVLSPLEREITYRIAMDGQTIEEVSTETGFPVKVIHTIYRACINRLHQEITGQKVCQQSKKQFLPNMLMKSEQLKALSQTHLKIKVSI